MRNIFRKLKEVEEPVENNEDYNMDYYAGVGRTQTPVGTIPVGAGNDSEESKMQTAVEDIADTVVESESVTNEDYEEPEDSADIDDDCNGDEDDGGCDVTVYAPEDNFACADIVHDLVDGGIVIINTSKMDGATIRRVFDFIMGAVTALDAELLRRDHNTVVVGPAGVDLEDFCDSFDGYEFED